MDDDQQIATWTMLAIARFLHARALDPDSCASWVNLFESRRETAGLHGLRLEYSGQVVDDAVIHASFRGQPLEIESPAERGVRVFHRACGCRITQRLVHEDEWRVHDEFVSNYCGEHRPCHDPGAPAPVPAQVSEVYRRAEPQSD